MKLARENGQEEDLIEYLMRRKERTKQKVLQLIDRAYSSNNLLVVGRAEEIVSNLLEKLSEEDAEIPQTTRSTSRQARAYSPTGIAKAKMTLKEYITARQKGLTHYEVIGKYHQDRKAVRSYASTFGQWVKKGTIKARK